MMRDYIYDYHKYTSDYDREMNTYTHMESDRKGELMNEYHDFMEASFFSGITGAFFGFIIANITNSVLYTVYLIAITVAYVLYLGYKKYKNIKNINAKYGEKMKSDAEMDSADEFYYQEYNGDDIKEPANKYPEIGLNTVITTIEDIYVPQDKTDLIVKADTPFRFMGEWTYEYPFTWDTEELEDGSYPFAYFAENQGYTKDNYNEMIGQPIAIKIKGRQWNTLVLDNVEELIRDRLDSGDITVSDIDVEQINEMYDIELPDEIPVGSDIIMEDNPWENDTIDDWR